MWDLIIGSILKYFSLWVDAKQAKALAWENKVLKGKLSSTIKTHEIEKRIASAKPLHKSVTPAAWNQRVPPELLCLLLCLVMGCGPVFVESRWPIIDKPARPTLPESPIIFTHRELILVDYAEILELTIQVYNEGAYDHNRENGYVESVQEKGDVQ